MLPVQFPKKSKNVETLWAIYNDQIVIGSVAICGVMAGFALCVAGSNTTAGVAAARDAGTDSQILCRNRYRSPLW